MIKKKKPDVLPIPKKLQDVIPVQKIYPDGVFETTKGNYCKTWIFNDINYRTAGKEEKQSMALKWGEVLNSFDTESKVEISINKRKMNVPEFEQNVLLKTKEDGLDKFRDEYNGIMKSSIEDSNMMQRECYITVSIHKKNYQEAKNFFQRIEVDLVQLFTKLGSKLKPLDAERRFHIIHDFYRAGEEADYHLDIKDMIRHGVSDARAYVCPDSMEIKDDYIKIGNRYVRTLIIKEMASYVKDDIITKLQDITNTSILSFSITPVATDVAVEQIERKLMSVEKNIITWSQKQNRRKIYTTMIPYDMEQQRKEVREFLDDLMNRDQRMMYVTFTMVHSADSLEKLNEDTESILTTARNSLCQMSVLNYQQYDALNTTLPWGLNALSFSRTMTTESMLAFNPFYVQEINDTKGNYYGKNAISQNMILADKEKLKNANMMILAVPGGGKSMLAKNEAAYNILSDDNTDVIIIDPEREYGVLTKSFGGEVINISATGGNYINLMEINKDYAIEEDEPVAMKSQFIMSVCEQIIGDSITAKEKSIIDRCVRNVYENYINNDYEGDKPNLQNLYDELRACPEPEARDISLALELFVTGSLNVFAHETNVNQDSRFLCYDLLDMDSQLQPVGMLAVLDNILNRVTRNRFKGRKTVIIIEEMYLYLQYPYSADFLYKLWKRIRKYNGYCVGITQNVRDLRKSPTARTMLSNSEFVILLSQAEDDIEDLKTLCHISEEQMQYVNDADPGCGLMKLGKTIMPFENIIPEKTSLYKLMTSKPGEALNG